jgi:hypothetical protein
MEKKPLRPRSSLPKRWEQQPAEKGGEERVKFLKAIMIVAVLVTTLGLGACAKKQETVTTTAGTTGYAK